MSRFHVKLTLLLALALPSLDLGKTETVLLLSISGVTRVCPGYPLTVTCRVEGLSNRNQDFIQWNITTNVDGRSESRQRFLAASGQSFIAPVTFNTTTLNLTLETNANDPDVSSITLTSNVSVNVTPLLNKTVIECSAFSVNTTGVGTDTINIHVIKSESLDIVSLSTLQNVISTSNDNVIVNLSWMEDIDVSYDVYVSPTTTFNFITPSSVELSLSYNVSYTVTVVGTRCNRNVSTAVREFRYAQCQNIRDYFEADNPHIRVSGSNGPVIEGTIVALECTSPELSLVQFGPNMTTCNSNGQWEPDPTTVECIVDCGLPQESDNVILIYNSTLEGSELTYSCGDFSSSNNNNNNTVVCQKDGSWTTLITAPICELTASPGASNLLPDLLIISMSMIGAFLILIGIVLGIIARKKCFTKTLSINEAINQVDISYQEDSNEYSVLQHPVQFSKPLTQKDDSNECRALERSVPRSEQQDNTTHQSTHTGLVYADVGDFLIQRKRCVPIHELDDDRVEYSQVNFDVAVKPSVVNSQKGSQHADDLLNLDSLMIQLKAEVTPKWYEFGIASGMEKAMLDKYSKYPSEQCIIEVLDHWLRNHPGSPTWREVAEILRKIGPGLESLASAIEDVYETGKLPIEVNVDNDFHPELITDDPDSRSTPPPIPPRTG